jgi:hypothetical protein
MFRLRTMSCGAELEEVQPTTEADTTAVLAIAALPIFFQNVVEEILTIEKIRAHEPL